MEKIDNNSYKIPSNKKPFSPVMKKLIFLVVFCNYITNTFTFCRKLSRKKRYTI